MRTRKYLCDGGSLAIQCNGIKVNFSNCFGDGTHRVYILTNESKDHHPQTDKEDVYRGCIEVPELSEALVLSYDCTAPDTKIIERLGAGRYGVSAIKDTGDMIIEKWD